jgi:hypothetical protein
VFLPLYTSEIPVNIVVPLPLMGDGILDINHVKYFGNFMLPTAFDQLIEYDDEDGKATRWADQWDQLASFCYSGRGLRWLSHFVQSPQIKVAERLYEIFTSPGKVFLSLDSNKTLRAPLGIFSPWMRGSSVSHFDAPEQDSPGFIMHYRAHKTLQLDHLIETHNGSMVSAMGDWSIRAFQRMGYNIQGGLKGERPQSFKPRRTVKCTHPTK